MTEALMSAIASDALPSAVKAFLEKGTHDAMRACNIQLEGFDLSAFTHLHYSLTARLTVSVDLVGLRDDGTETLIALGYLTDQRNRRSCTLGSIRIDDAPFCEAGEPELKKESV